MTSKYILRSKVDGLYWRGPDQGRTPTPEKAHRYSMEEAIRIRMKYFGEQTVELVPVEDKEEWK